MSDDKDYYERDEISNKYKETLTDVNEEPEEIDQTEEIK